MSALFVTTLLCALEPTPVHATHALQYEGVVPVLDRKTFTPLSGHFASPASTRFDRVVYGYYPYWASHDDTIPWEHLTHLAYFSVSLNPDGSLGEDHSFSTRGAALVEAGHQEGVKVVLTATMFQREEIRELLGSSENRNNAIEQLLSLVQDAGGDGVNIDFEFVPEGLVGESPTPKENFVTFMSDLTTAFHAAINESHVSLATPAVDWGGTYDYDELALATDGLMIMGYGYHWSGGNPGPVAPIVGGGIWGEKSLSWTIEDYLTFGGEENRGRFILGLPLYGREWPTTDLTVPGTATATGPAKSLAQCDTLFSEGKLWDETSSTPYKLISTNGQPSQLFCEDLESLAAKYELIEAYDLGGVMFWDVGKVSGSHSVWSQVSTAFAAASEEPAEPTTVDDALDPNSGSTTQAEIPSNDNDEGSNDESGGCVAATPNLRFFGLLLTLLYVMQSNRRPVFRKFEVTLPER